VASQTTKKPARRPAYRPGSSSNRTGRAVKAAGHRERSNTGRRRSVRMRTRPAAGRPIAKTAPDLIQGLKLGNSCETVFLIITTQTDKDSVSVKKVFFASLRLGEKRFLLLSRLSTACLSREARPGRH